MQVLVYDGSYLGLITAIFDVYEYKFKDVKIVPPDQPLGSLFGETRTVSTDTVKTKRVLKGLDQRVSRQGIRDLYITFLSGIKGIEDIILQYVRYVFSETKNIERDYSHPAVLTVIQTVKKVRREKHRMEAFVRFQLTKDQLFYAIVQPDYNVLPLISTHFEKRYADQRWLIYDAIRKYGIYYDLNEVVEVDMKFENDLQGGSAIAAVYDEKEVLYQQLWKQYFDSVNIAARRNMKLHIQHMPKRYWRFLTEKK